LPAVLAGGVATVPPEPGGAGHTAGDLGVQRLLLGTGVAVQRRQTPQDRKSTRLNSSHVSISYAVFCLKKKTLLCENRYSSSCISCSPSPDHPRFLFLYAPRPPRCPLSFPTRRSSDLSSSSTGGWCCHCAARAWRRWPHCW